MLVAAFFYILATLIRVGMAREAAKGGNSQPKALSFAGLKSNLSSMFGIVFAGGIISWILITDGVRDTSFALSMNLLPVYLQDIGRMSMLQIGWMNSVFGLCMMLMMIPGGWLADKISERVVIAIGMGLIGVSMLMMVSTPSGLAWMYFASWALAGLGVGCDDACLSIVDQQIHPEGIARHRLWFVQHKPGDYFPACSVDRRTVMGWRESSLPVYGDGRCGPAFHYSHFAQIPPACENTGK